jgi:hypothetical protein
VADQVAARRAQGPELVVAGPADRPVLLVLDPSGAAPRGELPATWRDLTGQLRVVWCRLPAVSEPWPDLLSVLDNAGRAGPVDVLAAGPAATAALDLARAHPQRVRSLLLVDPASGSAPVPSAAEPMSFALWQDRSEHARAELATAGVRVQVVARSTGDDRDRVPPPLPLGHPDVVAQVTKALSES